METNLILEHELVPLHEKTSEESANELLQKLKIKKEMLPKILEKDPAAIAIGAKKGEILKITRDSVTAGKAAYYRLVV